MTEIQQSVVRYVSKRVFFSGDMQTKHGSVGVNSNCSLLSAHVFIDSMFMNLQRVRARKLRELDRPAPVYAI